MMAHKRAHGGGLTSRLTPSLIELVAQMAGSWSYRQKVSRYRRVSRARARDWLRPELLDYLPAASKIKQGLNEVLARSVTDYPLPLYLRVEDRNSMAHSLEVRVPFLDHRLVEMVFQLDGKWKLNGPWNKFVMREALQGRIPESVRTRVDKMGFPADAAGWLRGPLFNSFQEVLADPGFRQSPLFNADILTRELSAHRDGKLDATARLFDAVQMFLWCDNRLSV